MSAPHVFTDAERRRGQNTNAAAKHARLEDYIELTREHRLRPQHAAERLGVTHRTVQRYKAIIRRSVTS